MQMLFIDCLQSLLLEDFSSYFFFLHCTCRTTVHKYLYISTMDPSLICLPKTLSINLLINQLIE